MMNRQEYEWSIKMVRERYQQYHLSFEQAERVFRYEEERDNVYAGRYSFSAWEEWDYEMSVFREILAPDQLSKYEEVRLEELRQVEQYMTEQDAGKLNDVRYAQERLDYYANSFLPDFQSPAFWQVPILLTERNKVDFIKHEYKVFVHRTKRQILMEHFRQHRLLMPNLLKYSLLWQEVDYLWPNYHAFRAEMDEPTRAVDAFLRAKVLAYEDKASFLEVKLEELRVSNFNRFEKYYKDGSGGWHVLPAKKSREEAKQDGLMTLLLLDRDKYGLEAYKVV
jgi:hypothetical protein